MCGAVWGSASGSASGSAADGDVLARYDDDRNRMIACKTVRRHGIAPVLRSHLAYKLMPYGAGDGVVCG